MPPPLAPLSPLPSPSQQQAGLDGPARWIHPTRAPTAAARSAPSSSRAPAAAGSRPPRSTWPVTHIGDASPPADDGRTPGCPPRPGLRCPARRGRRGDAGSCICVCAGGGEQRVPTAPGPPARCRRRRHTRWRATRQEPPNPSDRPQPEQGRGAPRRQPQALPARGALPDQELDRALRPAAAAGHLGGHGQWRRQRVLVLHDLQSGPGAQVLRQGQRRPERDGARDAARGGACLGRERRPVLRRVSSPRRKSVDAACIGRASPPLCITAKHLTRTHTHIRAYICRCESAARRRAVHPART